LARAKAWARVTGQHHAWMARGDHRGQRHGIYVEGTRWRGMAPRCEARLHTTGEAHGKRAHYDAGRMGVWRLGSVTTTIIAHMAHSAIWPRTSSSKWGRINNWKA